MVLFFFEKRDRILRKFYITLPMLPGTVLPDQKPLQKFFDVRLEGPPCIPRSDQNELLLTSELKRHPTNITDSADSHLAETCTGTHRRQTKSMVRYLELFWILLLNNKDPVSKSAAYN
jgi:hypothetical protein